MKEKIFLKTQYKGQRNHYFRVFILIYSLLLIVSSLFYHHFTLKIKGYLDQGTEQVIFVSDERRPIIDSQNCIISQTASNQYKIEFSDKYEYSFIMKQLEGQYPLSQIKTSFLEDQYINTYSQQLKESQFFYRLCLILSFLFMNYIYISKTIPLQIQYVLLVKLLGYNRFQQRKLLVKEFIIYIPFFLLVLLFRELLLMVLSVIIYYSFIRHLENKEFVDLYRN